MKQFYETYKDSPKLSTLLREISWLNNLHIMSKTNTPEEKEFYLRLAAKERYSARELERQKVMPKVKPDTNAEEILEYLK